MGNMNWHTLGTVYGLNILIAIAIFIVGKKIADIIKIIISKAFENSKVDKTLAIFLTDIIYALIIVIVVLNTLNQIGVQTTSFIAILASAGLAVGLAFQNSLSNIGAGVMIIFFQPFKIGNSIEAAGTSGTVESVNLFNTTLKTADNKVVIVANSNIIKGNITNFSVKETRRVDMIFGIGYDDNLKLAKQTLVDIVTNDERVLKDPEPFVAVSELGDSSVNFVVRVWVNKDDYSAVKFDTTENVKLTFDEKNISIPYPQINIHTSSK